MRNGTLEYSIQALNPKFIFESFIVGPSNQFAYNAARAVAEAPSTTYNPLYIYGGSGLGKTHLLHAIGHRIKGQSPETRLIYITLERFMNELINSIHYNKTIEFREKYRNIDVLLMDDIQFLAGRERTQEEFLHTFNSLYNTQKQIVISSDVLPKRIPTLEERLYSRFEGGLVVDIEPPDLETKLTILRKKAEAAGLALSEDAALFIVSNIKSNIRRLEGAITKLSAFSLQGSVDVNSVNAVIPYLDKIPYLENLEPISAELIQRTVADHYRQTLFQMMSKDKSPSFVRPRQIAMYLCRSIIGLSFPNIARHFRVDHSTVFYTIHKIQQLRETDRKLDNDINELFNLLNVAR